MTDKYKQVFTALQSTIRTASGVAAQDISFYRRLDKPLDQSAKKQSEKLLGLANYIMQNVAKGEVDEIVAEDTSDDLTDNWHEVNVALDTLTFKIDNCLAAHKKQQKKEDSKATAAADGQKKPGEMIKITDGRAEASGDVKRHQFDLPKPQLKFKTPVDNSKDKPFHPRLTEKPNAIVSFEETVKLTEPSEESGLARPYFPQPYEREIMDSSYPKTVYEKHDPVPSLPWSTTEPIWVDTPEKLQKMIDQISSANELALDLEHHDYRSFLGFTCLLQLSDRKSDFIIDTLALRDDLQPLNEIFTNPQIIKVLHGASMDIIWLQRDLGLYIVSLFDTFHASKRLGLKRHALAYLLETYANFQTSKKYQLADWRMRPIPAEMLSYAQSDTHFLLNIYDQMKNQLIDNNVLPPVLEESRKTAAQRFENPGYDTSKKALTDPFNEPLERLIFKNNLDRKQRVFLEALYDWRDATARRIDESPSFVMPVHTLIALSSAMPLTVSEILHKAGPQGSRLREYSKELQKLMVAASKVAANISETEPTKVDDVSISTFSAGVVDYDSILDNLDAYEKSFQTALSLQRSLFEEKNISKITKKLSKPVSQFWGVTLLSLPDSPEDDTQFFPIEHFPEGITLYASTVGNPTKQVEEVQEQQPQTETTDDRETVFIGQSNETKALSSTMDAIREQDSKSRSADTIMMPTAAELLGSGLRLLTKNEKKKIKREKRRAEALEAGEQTTSSDAATPEPEESQSKNKNKNKNKNKKNKRAISEVNNEEDHSKETSPKKAKKDDDVPFDFATAPSVLNSVDDNGAKSKKKKKAFNPYAEITPTLTGAVKKNVATQINANTSVSYKVKSQKK
ncbi:uncharacterized protein SAPINGB_P004901 [Magnusiomyces paraingens]|uniref:HRDC domain-containing protein n=1 Tax=Magnusiomyces paraingens TaxID=2606893 RepID=A0A5E8BYS2_9ASCO|nr:uncharacterized protein SAPINGB_P004901 [Saprochaete ingens]VVT56222.1 unnamed protein product [Saprochaete ingens]